MSHARLACLAALALAACNSPPPYGYVDAGGLLCVAGSCYQTSCDGGSCPNGKGCVSGACVFPQCLSAKCKSTEACAYGNCYPKDCETTCPASFVCSSPCGDPLSCPSECTEDVCVNITCASQPDGGQRACKGGVCVDTSCSDGLQNGDESDVDCGGACSTKCALGQKCVRPADCVSGACLADKCGTPSCTDGIRDGDESDTDCGGSCGAKCKTGHFCFHASDCVSKVCNKGILADDAGVTRGTCQAPRCDDGVLNGTETDVDCGGPDCDQPCAKGKKCGGNSDCQTSNCQNGVCA
jgi:hypothetical protein